MGVAIKERLEGLPVVGTVLAVQKRYTEDAADPLAAAIAFFAFLSLFPLMLLAVSVAGFILQDPADQVAVAEAITEAIPGFEATLADDESDAGVADLVGGVVEQRGTVGIIGLVLLLFSGLRVVNAAMTSTRVVFRGETVTGVVAKLRQIAALVGLGLVALAGVAGSSLAAIGFGQLPGFLAVLVSLAVSFAFDLLLFFAAYTLLSSGSSLAGRQLVPGALLGAAGWTVLKVAGSTWVSGQVENANALYGALGGVIALLLLFYLAGRLYLYGAELSAVLAERNVTPAAAPRNAVRPGIVEDPSGDGTSEGRPPAGAVAATRRAGRSTPDDVDQVPVAGRVEAGRPVIAQVVAGRSAPDVVAESRGPVRDVERDGQRAASVLVAAAALVLAWRFVRDRS